MALKETGRPVDFTYLQPRKSKKDARGDDFFVGEEELMKYLDKLDLELSPERQRNLEAEFANADNGSESSYTPEEDAQDSEDDDNTMSQKPIQEFVMFLLETSTTLNLQMIPMLKMTTEATITSVLLSTTLAQMFNYPVPSDPFRWRFGIHRGLSNIASGRVSAAFLKTMSDSGWSDLATTTPYDYLQTPNPIRIIFYFMQPDLWDSIAEETNVYFREKINERVNGLYAKQVTRERKNTGFKAKPKEELQNELQKTPDIAPRELCVFLGLLIARSIALNKEKLAHHWRTTDEGAIPRGCFDLFMARHRFMHLSRNLHFSRNDDVRARTDRALKLRPIIDALQDRFTAGYIPPAIMAFDEAMLPSRSTFHRMRVHMKDKPHNGAPNSSCCAVHRLRIASGLRYTVAKKRDRVGRATVPAAVVRNLQEVFGPAAPANGSMRRVVTDLFYSAVPLSMQLLTMGFYSIGTVRTDRLGLSSKLIPRKKKDDKKKVPKIPKNRPSNIERGTYTVAKALQVPDMKVLR
ncbi:LOW QUALITY PROTEIN: hypothetical protein PHMEG_00021361, partial [Phytophthora megakarya]